MSSLHAIYASTSGHTEFVLEQLAAFLREKGIDVSLRRAEKANIEDLFEGDILLLGSGTWNTGGSEGRLNPHMQAFLFDRAKDIDLKGKPLALVALGDQRYRYTARAAEHLLKFQKDHHGTPLLPPLVIVNEPYDQGERIRAWGEKLIVAISKPQIPSPKSQS
ncbi:MAG: flavodoxin domain-containing protein [Candidatus Peribacteraceae bacterium]|jgi:flavodoxin